MKIDYILLDTTEKPLPTSWGYNWIGGIDSRNWYTSQDSGALLLLQLQNNASLFEQGGYIEDLPSLLRREMAALSFSTPNDAGVMEDFVLQYFQDGAFPGMSVLDDRSDISLLLSVYGKVSSRLPESAKVTLANADSQAGQVVLFPEKPGIVERIRTAFARKERSKLTCGDVGHAAVDVVKGYTSAIEAGRMTVTPERAMSIKWAMRSIYASIEQELSADRSPTDERVLQAIDDSMLVFEDVVASRSRYPARSGSRADGRLSLVSNNPHIDMRDEAPAPTL